MSIKQTENLINCIAIDIEKKYFQSENFNEQQISFPMCKTMRKVTAKQLFELFYFFTNRNK